MSGQSRSNTREEALTMKQREAAFQNQVLVMLESIAQSLFFISEPHKRAYAERAQEEAAEAQAAADAEGEEE